MNVFLDGCFALVHGKLPHNFRLNRVNALAAAQDNHMVGIHRTPATDTQKIAMIDVQREHRPQ